jgi:hypothetical protein
MSTLPSAYPGCPELAGPGQETASGAILYGESMTQPRIGPMPLPTQEERAAEAASRARLIASCQCSVIPGVILGELRQLAQRAMIIPAEGIGCPRCRAVPQGLISELAEAIETGAAQ